MLEGNQTNNLNGQKDDKIERLTKLRKAPGTNEQTEGQVSKPNSPDFKNLAGFSTESNSPDYAEDGDPCDSEIDAYIFQEINGAQEIHDDYSDYPFSLEKSKPEIWEDFIIEYGKKDGRGGKKEAKGQKEDNSKNKEESKNSGSLSKSHTGSYTTESASNYSDQFSRNILYETSQADRRLDVFARVTHAATKKISDGESKFLTQFDSLKEARETIQEALISLSEDVGEQNLQKNKFESRIKNPKKKHQIELNQQNLEATQKEIQRLEKEIASNEAKLARIERFEQTKENIDTILDYIKKSDTKCIAIFGKECQNKLLVGINGKSNKEFVEIALQEIFEAIHNFIIGKQSNATNIGIEKLTIELREALQKAAVVYGQATFSESSSQHSSSQGTGSKHQSKMSKSSATKSKISQDTSSYKLSNKEEDSIIKDIEHFVEFILRSNQGKWVYDLVKKGKGFEVINGSGDDTDKGQKDIHAEVNIIDHLVNSKFDGKGEFYIGNNKKACQGCKLSIGYFNSLDHKFKISYIASHNDLKGVVNKDGIIYSPPQFIIENEMLNNVLTRSLLKKVLPQVQDSRIVQNSRKDGSPRYFESHSQSKKNPPKKSKKEASDTHWYAEDEVNILLNNQLTDREAYTIISQTQFEHTDLLIDNTIHAVQEALRGNVVVMPIHLHGNHWTGAMFRQNADGNLQVIYVDPTGEGVESNVNAQWLVATINKLASNAQIIDLQFEQQFNDYDCGRFTVNNLARLAQADFSNIDIIEDDDGDNQVQREEIKNLLLHPESGVFPSGERTLYRDTINQHDTAMQQNNDSTKKNLGAKKL